MKKAAVIFLFIIILITGGLKTYHLLEPVDDSSSIFIEVEIATGSSTRYIADKLEEKGLIRSATFFVLMTSVSGADQQLQAGFYEFSPSQSLLEIVEDLQKGNIATFQFTIPEGYTVEEIASLLAEKTEYSKNDFLTAANTRELAGGYFEIPDGDYIYELEGLLYPATYDLPRSYGPEDIMRHLVAEFYSRWGGELEEGILDYSPFEIITIASMVEKEGRLREEKPLIAGVIYNRLRNNMLLQMDATIQYALEQRQDIILYSDLRLDSYYNTYQYPGLPPGPIASPGDNALDAALNPEDTDYLFYFALEDGSHSFSRTYGEHRRKLQEFRERVRE